MNTISLDYNKELIPYAKQHRKRENMTKPEALVRHCILKWRKLLGYKFTRQKTIQNYIIDFYCFELKLAIEIDWENHSFQSNDDEKRDKMLNKLEISIIRIANKDVIKNLEWVQEYLEETVKNRSK